MTSSEWGSDAGLSTLSAFPSLPFPSLPLLLPYPLLSLSPSSYLPPFSSYPLFSPAPPSLSFPPPFPSFPVLSSSFLFLLPCPFLSPSPPSLAFPPFFPVLSSFLFSVSPLSLPFSTLRSLSHLPGPFLIFSFVSFSLSSPSFSSVPLLSSTPPPYLFIALPLLFPSLLSFLPPIFPFLLIPYLSSVAYSALHSSIVRCDKAYRCLITVKFSPR